MITKGSIIVLFLLCLATALLATNTNHTKSAIENKKDAPNGTHNLILGQRRFGDRLLFHNEIHVHRKLLRTVQYDVKFPSYIFDKNSVISYIEVLDLKKDSTGGYPSLHSGGINYTYATIRLTSQWNHGLHFNVTIYGS